MPQKDDSLVQQWARQLKTPNKDKKIWRIAWLGFLGGSDNKESACNAGDPGSIPGLGRFPGEGNGYPVQYSYLENPMNRRAWWATVHGVERARHYWVTFAFHHILFSMCKVPCQQSFYHLSFINYCAVEKVSPFYRWKKTKTLRISWLAQSHRSKRKG